MAKNRAQRGRIAKSLSAAGSDVPYGRRRVDFFLSFAIRPKMFTSERVVLTN
ncbi:hypothetical protein [Rhizobium chutanense]|uniref:hypothetical protein n=1 Tax=Rhizobium chutanense TaxID=2035448 RepID=UPI0013DF203B|nr:hypothetical protein [Rhizobium chutanense]